MRENLLQSSAKVTGRGKYLFLSSFALTFTPNYRKLERWFKKGGFTLDTDVERIFIVINYNNEHWALGLIDMKEKTLVYYDSLKTCVGSNPLMPFVSLFLKPYFMKQYNVDLPSKWPSRCQHVPKQTNAYDCGMFTIL